MWEKIKKFFKWIADHTGISWIARKISSGWKWLFGGKANADYKDTSQRGKSSEPETPDDKPIKTHTPNQPTPTTIPDEPKKPVVNPPKTNIKPTGGYLIPSLQNANSKTRASYEGELEIINNELWLHFKKPLKYKGDYIYIKCGEDEYRIPSTNTDLEYMLVKSILKENKDGRYVNGNIVRVKEEIKRMKKMLELNNDGVVKVDSISNRAFEAPTLEQPKPNTTGNNVTQQVVNNGGVATEPKKFFDAEDDGVTQPRSLTTDLAVEQSTPVSSSKAPTNGTLPKVASSSETKNGSNNGAVVLCQMLHDQGRLHLSPELYDYLLRASFVKEMLLCKVVPNSSFTQPIAEQAAGNDHSR